LLDQPSQLEPTDRSHEQALAQAVRARTLLCLVGLACLVACLALLGEIFRSGPFASLSFDPVFVRLASAPLAILAGAFTATALVAQARLAAKRARKPSPPSPTEAEEPPRNLSWKGRLTAIIGRARGLPRRFDPVRLLAGGAQALEMLLGAGVAILILVRDWPMAVEGRPADSVFLTRGALALVAAFPLLLAERAYSGFAGRRLPEAPSLQLLLRLALLTFSCEGVLSLLEGYGFELARFVEPLLRVLILAIGAELGLRALAVFFQPAAEAETARAAVSSSIATLLMPGAIERASWRRSLQDELGIDLSRSWALRFLRSALIPVSLLLVLVAWGLSGVTILGPDQRGIYERLGRPVAIFRPGLHIGLPWPLGIVRPVDFGEIHALSLGNANALVELMSTLPGQEVVGVEAAAPPSADRLWDESHPTETSYLIASDVAGRSAFQIVDVDVELIWRIGLDDEAALASAYRAAEPQAFLRASAGRLLARYFSTRTLLGVLGQKREGLSDELRQDLQAALDKAGTGIELVAVVVEAIHPPAGAADSYHEVQAARIRSEVMIAEARRKAILVMGEARRGTAQTFASAEAAAAERVSVAQSDALRFATDERSYAAPGSTYLFERYLATLTRAFASVPITLLDHRISEAGGATIIDMRSLRALASPPADEDIGQKEPNK
jgi:regulator of protease activity HflC (stomatin/prohibitin superfamily)